MKYWIVCGFVLFIVFAGSSGRRTNDSCDPEENPCQGEARRCVDGQCMCERGYFQHYDGTCINCPGYGQQCFGSCCSRNGDLYCWQGICQRCHDPSGNWICGDNMNQIMLISATQIAMGTALILGILATFVLLYKLCITTDIRSYGRQSLNGARLSVGSMQLYVEERLRDPPPRYSRALPVGAAPMIPLHGYLNAGFIHDSSVPPPPYTASLKYEEPTPSTIHI